MTLEMLNDGSQLRLHLRSLRIVEDLLDNSLIWYRIKIDLYHIKELYDPKGSTDKN